MKPARSWLIGVALPAVLTMLGCEETPRPMTMPDPEPAATQASTRPVAWSRLSLAAVPLSAELPADWVIEPYGSFMTVRPPFDANDPGGVLVRRAILRVRENVSSETFDLALAQWQQRDSSDEGFKVELHTSGDIRIIEVIEDRPSHPTTLPSGSTASGVKQTFYVYSPGEPNTLQQSEISFSEASRTEYERQSDTVRRIVLSLRSDSTVSRP
jgi:hypothetical protein